MAGESKVAGDPLASELAGLHALELADSAHGGGGRARAGSGSEGPGLGRRLVAAVAPKAVAVALGLGLWQLVVWSGWRPDYLLPGPAAVLSELADQAGTTKFWVALAVTLRRAITGYALAVLVGVALGAAVARIRPLRRAVGSLITGLQTMPSIAWFPLAILLFQRSEAAILAVVVLGAAPSVASGLISGVDQVPPLLLRAGRMLGARGMTLFRHVVLPAALPSCLAGLKQGWAFAWRSLMAGELLVILANRPSIGASLQFAREDSDAPQLLALMLVVLVVGILADAVFTRADQGLRRRRGLVETAL